MAVSITGVILAGGKARRMQGQDKGLVLFQGKPMFLHTLQSLRKQVDIVAINANRNKEIYAKSGVDVFSDELAGFQGPLSGMLTALKRAKTDYVLFVPCDNPFLPINLAEKLFSALVQNQTQNGNSYLAYAQDGERPHPIFCLLSPHIVPALSAYLNRGERKVLTFMQENHAIAVDFSVEKKHFKNVNSLEELQKMNEERRI